MLKRKLSIDIEILKEPIIDETPLKRYKTELPVYHKNSVLIKKDEILDYGSYGTIYNATYNNRKVVVKKLYDKIGCHHLYSLKKLYNINEVNILRPLAISICHRNIVYKKIEGVSLCYDEFQKKDDIIKLELIKQLIDCVHNLHKYNIIHTDIKPNNFMIDKDNKITLVDIDSCVSMIDNIPYMHFLYPHYGTIGYYRNISKTVKYEDDLWALGATIYNLYTNKFPYQEYLDNYVEKTDSEKIYFYENIYYDETKKLNFKNIDSVYIQKLIQDLMNN